MKTVWFGLQNNFSPISQKSCPQLVARKEADICLKKSLCAPDGFVPEIKFLSYFNFKKRWFNRLLKQKYIYFLRKIFKRKLFR